jgi:hypothetical protein
MIKKKRFYNIAAGSSEGMTEMTELEKNENRNILKCLQNHIFNQFDSGPAMVAQWLHHCKIKGSSPAKATGIKREKCQISNLKIKFN